MPTYVQTDAQADAMVARYSPFAIAALSKRLDDYRQRMDAWERSPFVIGTGVVQGD